MGRVGSFLRRLSLRGFWRRRKEKGAERNAAAERARSVANVADAILTDPAFKQEAAPTWVSRARVEAAAKKSEVPADDIAEALRRKGVSVTGEF